MNTATKTGTQPHQRKFSGLPSLSGPEARAIALPVLATVVLILLTIAVFTFVPRYSAHGQPVLANADFTDGFGGWAIDGLITLHESEPGRIVLHNRDPARSAHLRSTIVLPPGDRHLRLSADLAADRVKPGPEAWQTARIYLVQVGADGAYLWQTTHHLVQLVGTTLPETVSAVFDVPDSTPSVMLGIELSHATGRLEVGNLQLELVEESALFRLAATLLIGGWSLLVFWVVMRLYRGVRSTSIRIGLVLAIGLLGAGLFAPALARSHLTMALFSAVGLDFFGSDIAGHALAFTLLALLVRLGRPRDPWLLHLSCWLLVGVATETLQLFAAGRAPQVADLLMDAIGAGLGLTLAEAGRKLWLWIEPAAPPSSGSD